MDTGPLTRKRMETIDDEVTERALRFIDGPDEVHLRVVARNELAKAKANPGKSLAYYTLPENYE